MSKEFRFSCTECGKCCTTAPQMTLSDMFRLYDKFAFRIALVGYAVPAGFAAGNYQLSKSLADHLENTVGALVLQHVDGTKVAVRMVAMAVSSPSAERCPQLRENGECGIYNERPQMCRTVPADYLIPEGIMDQNFDRVLEAIKLRQWKCNVDSDAPVAWKDGAFVDGHQLTEAYRAGIEAAKEDAPINHILEIFIERGQIPAKDLVAGLTRGAPMSLDAMMVAPAILQNAETFGLAGKLPSLEEFIDAQEGLVQELIDDNIRRKRSEDRPTTTMARSMMAKLAETRADLFSQ